MGLGQRRGSEMAMVDESVSAEPRAMERKSFWRAVVDSPLFHNTCCMRVQDVKVWALWQCKT
eukprot:scaffold1033_cov65-Cyclotella_meneghiniana.AAC.1